MFGEEDQPMGGENDPSGRGSCHITGSDGPKWNKISGITETPGERIKHGRWLLNKATMSLKENRRLASVMRSLDTGEARTVCGTKKIKLGGLTGAVRSDWRAQ